MGTGWTGTGPGPGMGTGWTGTGPGMGTGWTGWTGIAAPPVDSLQTSCSSADQTHRVYSQILDSGSVSFHSCTKLLLQTVTFKTNCATTDNHRHRKHDHNWSQTSNESIFSSAQTKHETSQNFYCRTLLTWTRLQSVRCFHSRLTVPELEV